jgi:ectoine hydroxylase-related dioxygenase (phytanoyl-CoA dioxygenase family)
MLASVKESIVEHGFAVLPQVLNKAEREELIDHLGPASGAGRRGILELAPIAKLARSDRLLLIVQPHLSAQPRPVRGIYFDKTADTNWLVSWHQDLTIAVRDKIDVAGFGPWSMKDGVPHVQPPVSLLEQMITFRLHLDDCNESNGALHVIPSSHRSGRLSPAEIRRFRNEQPASVCCVAAGDALLMRPLLLHSSGRSRTGGHRRVVHIEYACFDLPKGLHWHEGA